jgi:hypothetical protein
LTPPDQLNAAALQALRFPAHAVLQQDRRRNAGLARRSHAQSCRQSDCMSLPDFAQLACLPAAQ